jgi:outer membrane protein, multidrug efflux system
LRPQIDARADITGQKAGEQDFGTAATAGLAARWNLDLFGQTKTRAASAETRAEAARFNVEAARLSTRATAARLYIGVRTAQARAAAARDTIAALNDLKGLADVRFKAGLVSGLDPAQALSALDAARAVPAIFETQDTTARLALEALLTRPPGALSGTLQTLAPIPDSATEPPLGAPAGMLARRPDLKAADALLRAAGLDAEAARLDFLPQISLSAFLGGQGVDPETPFSSSGLLTNAVGAVAGPVFSFGRLEAAAAVADAVGKEAALAYRATATAAVRDVETAINALGDARRRVVSLTAAVASAREEVQIARARYTGGLAPFINVLSAERSVYAAQDALEAARGAAALALVDLNEALGLGQGD